MASEISGLTALHGYLKLGNLVTRLQVPFLDRSDRQPAFLARPRPPLRPASVPAASPGEPAATPAQALVPGHVAQTPDPPRHGEAFFR